MKFDYVKVGTEVVLMSRGWDSARVANVTNVTRAFFDIGGNRFRKDDGRQVGGDKWSRWSVAPYDDAAKTALAERDARDEMDRRRRELSNRMIDCADDVLMKVWEIVNAPGAGEAQQNEGGR